MSCVPLVILNFTSVCLVKVSLTTDRVDPLNVIRCSAISFANLRTLGNAHCIRVYYQYLVNTEYFANEGVYKLETPAIK